MDELLALVGGSWQPLLLYPGVVTGILATAFMRAVWSAHGFTKPPLAGHCRWQPAAVFTAGCVLLLLALLPLPRSYWAYPIDIIGALALLELPHWLRLAQPLRAPDAATRARAVGEAGTLLNVYVLLALAVAALGQASSSLLLTEVKRGQPPLRFAGLLAWAVALPPLLALGPWQVVGWRDWLHDLRRVAHIALLVALALPPGDQWTHTAMATAAALAFGSLALLHRLWRGDPQRWERLQPFAALALLAFLLAMSGQGWAARLR